MNSIKKNLILNVLYQILIMIIPFITTPYISRVLGADGIGRYSYAYAIAYYFVMFAMLGVNNYGNRTVAEVSGNKEKRSYVFWSIYFFQLYVSVISIAVYILYIIFICEDKLMGGIMITYVLSAAFDINWFFFGMEEFKITVVRNSLVKLIAVVCIFLFVKNDGDVYIYGFVNVIGFLISQIILWISLKKYVVFVKVKREDIKQHIVPNLILFIPIIAISLYKFMDKIMLGAMSIKREVGFYESSERIIQIPIALITALGTVMLPRISNLIAANKGEQGIQYMKKSIVTTLIVTSPLCFGIMAVAQEFVPWFYGVGFDKCIDLFQVLMPSCIFLGIANVIRTQYLIPYKKDNVYILSVVVGAIVNLILNIIFIPRYESVGAALATLAAEATVCIVQCIAICQQINVFKYVLYGSPFIFFSFCMYEILRKWTFLINGYFAILVIKIFIGILIYIGLAGLWILVVRKSYVKRVL